MNTFINEYEYEFEEKKSKFISIIFHIETEEDFNNKLNDIKIKYPKATHYVYAYKLIDTARMNDDGEPSGTGALPIMNVIDKENLINIGIIVVRYFGGTKLGAGGLIRAYSKAASKLIDKDRLNVLEDGYLIDIELKFSDLKDIEYIVNTTNSKIINKSFDNTIIYTIEVKKKNINSFDKYNYKIKKDTMIIS